MWGIEKLSGTQPVFLCRVELLIGLTCLCWGGGGGGGIGFIILAMLEWPDMVFMIFERFFRRGETFHFVSTRAFVISLKKYVFSTH